MNFIHIIHFPLVAVAAILAAVVNPESLLFPALVIWAIFALVIPGALNSNNRYHDEI